MILSASEYEVGTRCLLFPSLKTAEACRSFTLQQLELPQSSSKVKVQYITELFGTPLPHEIFALLFHEDQEKLVMGYWMFAGEGISSRLAEQCLLGRSGDEQHQSQAKLGLSFPPDHEYSEYYQKHIPLSSVKDAKDAVRMRYAGIIPGGGNIRGVSGVTIDDVFLYPTGMTAIWNCHKLLAATIGSRIGITLKIAHVK
jgi:cystathionine gamma-synthase